MLRRACQFNKQRATSRAEPLVCKINFPPPKTHTRTSRQTRRPDARECRLHTCMHALHYMTLHIVVRQIHFAQPHPHNPPISTATCHAHNVHCAWVCECVCATVAAALQVRSIYSRISDVQIERSTLNKHASTHTMHTHSNAAFEHVCI